MQLQSLIRYALKIECDRCGEAVFGAEIFRIVRRILNSDDRRGSRVLLMMK
jgi:hypothetical protein